MKVGIVTHYMPPHHGGIERVAESLFVGYRRSGMSVRWVASRAPDSAPRREGDRVRVACWNAAERLLGVPVPLWGREGWREVAALAGWADVLHVHDCLYPGSALAVALARRRGTPILLSQHVGFVRYRMPVLNWLEAAAYATLGRAVLRGVGRLALATPAAEAHVTALLGGRPGTARSIPNGIDTERFAPATPAARGAARARLGLDPALPVVLFAGRLVEKKGVDLVLEVGRRLPATQLLVVGDGPLAGLLRDRPPRLVWLPRVEPERMHECYHTADCLLLPSHGEGLPLVVQEAMACGLPAVVSESETYARALVEGGACLGAARSADALSGRVSQILAGGGRELGPRARRFAESHWSAETMTARYVALLRELAPAAPDESPGETR